MKLLSKSNAANFMIPRGIMTGLQELGEQVPRLWQGVSRVGSKGVKNAQVVSSATPTLAEAMTEAQKLHNTSKWGNRINAAMIATTPIGIAPLFMENADTKALEKMREEDKRRQALGLPPLAINKQLQESTSQPTFSKTTGTIRIIDLTPEHIISI